MVIDTDGSAFITKAEFDSLKNNFQAQIDNYNSSIDSKIDGAIASYLSGIKMSSTESLDHKQSVVKNIADVDYYEGVNGGQVIMTTLGANYAPANCYAKAGLQIAGIIRWDAIPSRGVIGNTLSDLNNQVVFLEGTGTVSEVDVGYQNPSDSSNNVNNATALVERVVRYQVFMWYDKVSYSASYPQIPTADTRYDDNDKDLNFRWICYSNQLNAGNTMGSNARTPLEWFSRTRSTQITSYDLYNVNDEEVRVIHDKNKLNGFTIKLLRWSDMVGSTNLNASAWIKVRMFGLRYESNSATQTLHPNEAVNDAVNNYGWTRVTSGADAADTIIDSLNTSPTTSGVYINIFDGYNRLIGPGYMKNPGKLLTNTYSSSEFDTWLVNNCGSDVYEIYNSKTYFNIRYGLLLLYEPNESGTRKYTINVKNNGAFDCGFKILDTLDSSNFTNSQGISTDQSDAGNKNEITLPAGTNKIIEFSRDQNTPLFFKCSDGASIEFVGDIKKVKAN